MAGMIPQSTPTAPAAAASASGAPPVTDALLQKAIAGIEAKLSPSDMQAYQRVVLAGLKVMFDPSTHNLMLKSLQTSKDPATAIGVSISALVQGLYRESKNSMPINIAMMAAITLMAHEMDYMEKTMGLQVSADLIANASQATLLHTMERFGISKQKMLAAMQQAHTLAQNPQVAAQMKAQQGA